MFKPLRHATEILTVLGVGFMLSACGATASAPPTAAPATAAPPTEVPPTAVPEPIGSAMLPQSLYFLNAEDQQIWRLERDGQTKTQITTEQRPISVYDVAEQTGALVYLITTPDDGMGNFTSTLVLLDANGRTELVSGSVYQPVITPDGSEIAYILQNPEPGLIIGQDESPSGVYASTNTGGRPMLIQADDPIPNEMGGEPAWSYTPIGYDPSGTRLALWAYDMAGPAIPGGDVLVFNRTSGEDPIRIATCCADVEWNADGQSLMITGGMPGPDTHYGLYELDLANATEVPIYEAGEQTLLLSAAQRLADDRIYFVGEFAPGGMVTFDYPYQPLLQRQEPDTTISVLSQPLTARPIQTLIAPDGSGMAVVTMIENLADFPGGEMLWVPANAPVVPLGIQGQNLQWANQ